MLFCFYVTVFHILRAWSLRRIENTKKTEDHLSQTAQRDSNRKRNEIHSKWLKGKVHPKDKHSLGRGYGEEEEFGLWNGLATGAVHLEKVLKGSWWGGACSGEGKALVWCLKFLPLLRFLDSWHWHTHCEMISNASWLDIVINDSRSYRSHFASFSLNTIKASSSEYGELNQFVFLLTKSTSNQKNYQWVA